MQINSARNNILPLYFGSKNNAENKQTPDAHAIKESDANSYPYPETKLEDCFNKNYELNPIIKKELDNSKFIIQTDNGEELLSIKDAIGRFTYNDWGNMSKRGLYHACRYYEIVDGIISEGFKPEYISRTMYGPGFYFTGSEGDARNYGTAIMRADLEGHCVILDPKWYDKISNSGVLGKIEKFTNMDYKKTEKVLNEYVRSTMVEDLGIDYAHCMGNYVCFNPNSIKNMTSCEHLKGPCLKIRT